MSHADRCDVIVLDSGVSGLASVLAAGQATLYHDTSSKRRRRNVPSTARKSCAASGRLNFAAS
jgi:hypothetical protein